MIARLESIKFYVKIPKTGEKKRKKSQIYIKILPTGYRGTWSLTQVPVRIFIFVEI
jgi:hypothetical protein